MWAVVPRGEEPGLRGIMILPDTGGGDTGEIYTHQGLVAYGSLAIGDIEAAGYQDIGDRYRLRENN